MLAVSNSLNLFQNIEWEFDPYHHPMEMMVGSTAQDHHNLDIFPLYDSSALDFLPTSGYPLFQDYDVEGGRGQSPLSSGDGSGDYKDHDHQNGHNDVLTKKRKNHNESERDRRKKINGLYSSLRALLPASDQTKKLSIPSTVGRVLKYIPDLQNEVEDLTLKKSHYLSRISALQGDHIHNQEKEIIINPRKLKKSKMTKDDIIKTSSSTSISIDKVEGKEVIIHICTSPRLASLPELLLHLERVGLVVIHVSCVQSFGGRYLYNLHLEGAYNNLVNSQALKQELHSIIDQI